MITHDPEKREKVIFQILEALESKASPDEKRLLLSFAPVMLSETPDHVLFQFSPETFSQRLFSHFNFFVKEMPPHAQIYKGLPGIHVSVYNPDEAEARALGGGAGLPLETTVVRTHAIDAPFIFESLKNYFSKSGLRVFSAAHPIFSVRRQWEQIAWIGDPQEEGIKESYCFFQIEPVDSKDRLRRMQHEIFSVLKCVFLAVEDFAVMTKAMKDFSQKLKGKHAGDPQEKASAKDFIEWLLDENYVFLGVARYSLGGDGSMHRIQDSACGAFNDPELLPIVFPGLMEEVEARLMPSQDDARIVALDFNKNSSAIYHLDPLDYMVLREWGGDGALTGIYLVLGRFARGTFVQRADRIPILRDKIRTILKDSGAVDNSHIYRELITAFNRMPMRELFYAPPSALKSIIEPMAFMLGDDEIIVRTRKGVGYQVLSIAFSRLHYSYGTEESIHRALTDAFGPILFQTRADCGAATLLLFYFDLERLDHQIDEENSLRVVAPLVTAWEDFVAAELESAFGEREGRRLFNRYVTPDTRSGLYREVTPPEMVAEDVRRLEALESGMEARIVPQSENSVILHLYSLHPLGLTAALKTLENLGLEVTDELRIPLQLPENRECNLYRFEASAPGQIPALVSGEKRFIEALRAIIEARATDDAMNGLILSAGLHWRELELLRTVRNHLLQLRPNYNVETINRVLLNNSLAAGALFGYFASRFDPLLIGDRSEAAQAAEKEVQLTLSSVKSLAEDEILHALHHLLQCAVRTNFYQSPERPVFAIKVDSRKIEGIPSPKPLYEIYVHSNRLEGIHLRGGMVARGGIRWSDRQDDFRIEILGLMQTQMLKNTIIVPVGSKGGFVLKGKIPAAPALDAYLADRYSEYIAGLLDVTDNISDGKIIHPPEVARHDGDDPYLVVAADKGTAHLSDTANEISRQYGFWLGDAFASGGKTGFDHKKIGITARGAWECIKHHFRNAGIDYRKDAFTVCGIGDMSGDVFGNGMLYSKNIRLIGAFNHMHIFIDPNPDQEKGYAERKRLFDLPRSTWRDYDVSAISEGGGIFDRAARSIPLSPQMQKVLGTTAENASGEEIIRRLLTAPWNLLYNGGIGTYVKASDESSADAGDRANDRVRVNGNEIRARVIGEGGNLGFTQRARIECWMHGGLINTDALDNSAGVDTSDHEVNLKIFLDVLAKKSIVKDKEERNQILAEMTEEVAELVLLDNELQSRALTLDGLRSAHNYEDFVNLIDEMKMAGIIDPNNIHIPSREALLQSDQKSRGLPRPLLADLLGYIKMWGYEKLLRSDLPDNPIARPFLESYFPMRLRRQFSEYFFDHPLRKEITATAMVNYVTNNGGISLLPRLATQYKDDLIAAVSRYIVADQELSAGELRRNTLQSGLSAKAEHEELLRIEEKVQRQTSNLIV